jgi:NadR type nicotinamide-nucleotide adenylyltransferase
MSHVERAERREVAVVVVTGSESTGKTKLAADLARHYATTWVPEFARAYLDERLATTGHPLDASDVEAIARGHIVSADAAMADARELVVLDTDLVSTVVYSRHYYGDCPAWIEQAARDRLADLYLLCDIDAPWVADPARDRPYQREHLHGLFVAALDALGARTVTLRGSWADRYATAIAAIDALARRNS